jgi:hypothetical protein
LEHEKCVTGYKIRAMELEIKKIKSLKHNCDKVKNSKKCHDKLNEKIEKLEEKIEKLLFQTSHSDILVNKASTSKLKRK